MNLIDLKTEDKLGLVTVYCFYQDNPSVIAAVISGCEKYAKNLILTTLLDIDNLCISADIQGMEESTDTQYIIQAKE